MASDASESTNSGNPPSTGHVATFHLPDGSRLVVAVSGAVAFSCGGDRGPTRLELRGADRRVRVRGDLGGLLRRAGFG